MRNKTWVFLLVLNSADRKGQSSFLNGETKTGTERAKGGPEVVTSLNTKNEYRKLFQLFK